MSVELLRITRQELRQYDGRDGAPAYVAYNGTVYDVTGSFLWQKGRHQAMHGAGVDLTGLLDQAPHGVSFLQRFPIVGMVDDWE